MRDILRHKMKRPTTDKLIRFDKKAQVEKIQRAAELKHWTFTRFVIQSALASADQILVASKNGEFDQLMVEPNPLTLNQ